MGGIWLKEARERHNRAASKLERIILSETGVPGRNFSTTGDRAAELDEELRAVLHRLQNFLEAIKENQEPRFHALRVYGWQQLSIVHFNRALLSLRNNDVSGARYKAQLSFYCIRRAAQLRDQGPQQRSISPETVSEFLSVEHFARCRGGRSTDDAITPREWSVADGMIALEPCLLLIALWLEPGTNKELDAAEFWWEHAVEPVLSSIRDRSPPQDELVRSKLGRAQVLETILRWRLGRLSEAYIATLTETPHAAYIGGISALLRGDAQTAVTVLERSRSQYRRDDAERLLSRLQSQTKCAEPERSSETTNRCGEANTLFRARLWMQRGRPDFAIRLLVPYCRCFFSLRDGITLTGSGTSDISIEGEREIFDKVYPAPLGFSENYPASNKVDGAMQADHRNRHSTERLAELKRAKGFAAHATGNLVLTLADKGAIYQWKALPAKIRCVLLGSALASALAFAQNWDECLSTCHQLQRTIGANFSVETDVGACSDSADKLRRAYRASYVQLLLVYAEALLNLGFRKQSMKVLQRLWTQSAAVDSWPSYGMLISTRCASLFAESLLDAEGPMRGIIACIQETRMRLRLFSTELPKSASTVYEYCSGMLLNAEALAALANGSASNEHILGLLETAVRRSRYHSAVVYNLSLFLWARMGQVSRALRLWLRHQGIEPDDNGAEWDEILQSTSTAKISRNPFAAMTRACILLRRQQIADEQALQDLDFLKQIVA
ncbi:hypothetical protein CCYA_CCYA01G0257 [Cyanidiococcus yangmingshanensis]|nr:hypothetical protein CCYA_CCYA01G0257 [Cyanidiococcus yangmingshanensis]